MRAVKVNVNAPRDYERNTQCDRCNQTCLSSLFLGFECVGCRQYHCCKQCVQKNNFPLHAFCLGKQAAFDLRIGA